MEPIWQNALVTCPYNKKAAVAKNTMTTTTTTTTNNNNRSSIHTGENNDEGKISFSAQTLRQDVVDELRLGALHGQACREVRRSVHGLSPSAMRDSVRDPHTDPITGP